MASLRAPVKPTHFAHHLRAGARLAMKLRARASRPSLRVLNRHRTSAKPVLGASISVWALAHAESPPAKASCRRTARGAANRGPFARRQPSVALFPVVSRVHRPLWRCAPLRLAVGRLALHRRAQEDRGSRRTDDHRPLRRHNRLRAVHRVAYGHETPEAPAEARDDADHGRYAAERRLPTRPRTVLVGLHDAASEASVAAADDEDDDDQDHEKRTKEKRHRSRTRPFALHFDSVGVLPRQVGLLRFLRRRRTMVLRDPRYTTPFLTVGEDRRSNSVSICHRRFGFSHR